MPTITCHDARQHEETCNICGGHDCPIVQVDNCSLNYSYVDTLYICEACVHRMYVKCAAAFNIRPKLR